MSFVLLATLLLFQLAPGSRAVLFTDPSELPDVNYDFIVVGGGTAGSVVASRLTEAAKINVLLIEAGALNSDQAIEIPGFDNVLSPKTPFDWNDTTVPQPALDGRVVDFVHGHVLGGSSAINYLAYTRPSSEDMDRFAEFTGDSGWSWSSIRKYLNKSERHVESADKHDTHGQFLPSAHGFNGSIMTSLPGFPTDIDHRVLGTAAELNSTFPFNIDMNSGSPLGVGWLHSSIGNSSRSSAFTAYLSPFMHRTNLHILVGTQATRLFPVRTTGGSTQSTDFRGVEFAASPTAQVFRKTASKEVILSAGATRTPQLLLLSGIGDKKTLASHKITAAVDLPDVGKRLQDHPFVPFQWLVNSTSTFDTLVQNPTLSAESFNQYSTNGTGFLVSGLANHLAFLRVPPRTFRRGVDTSAGSKSAHIEFAFCNGFVTTAQEVPSTGNYLTIALVLVSPASAGSVSLSTASAFDKPRVDPGYLSDIVDLDALMAGARAMNSFLAATPWSGYILQPYGAAANTTTDAGMEQYIRQFITSIRHATGTAYASKFQDKFGVTNPDLTVKKTTGLRVVDASILPYPVSVHPQATVYGIAERAADLVKAKYRI
ncbi:aryl-alcohol oxidase-like protein [Mycena latifolia]|nr:aryl-alcohol oxidase-like protein [Mycena latifolia]